MNEPISRSLENVSLKNGFAPDPGGVSDWRSLTTRVQEHSQGGRELLWESVLTHTR